MFNYIRKIILEKQHKAKPIKMPVYRQQIVKKEIYNELNLQYKSYGNKNPNKFFYIIRRTPGAGFFSNLNFVISNLLICHQLNMIPIVDMENYPTLYNCKIKINNSRNSWNYFFESVSKYSLEEVYKKLYNLGLIN